MKMLSCHVAHSSQKKRERRCYSMVTHPSNPRPLHVRGVSDNVTTLSLRRTLTASGA